jgi:Fe2+ or Zn2+ uptake regulation protein
LVTVDALRIAVRARGAPSHRGLISRIVTESDRHMTADEVFVEARKAEPAISVATVYRNPRALVAEGALRGPQFAGVSRFDLNREPHAHLVCTSCGTIADFDPGMAGLMEPITRHAGDWEIDLEVRGKCPDCRCPERQ